MLLQPILGTMEGDAGAIQPFRHGEDRVHRVGVVDVVRGDQRRVDGSRWLAVQDVVDETIGL